MNYTTSGGQIDRIETLRRRLDVYNAITDALAAELAELERKTDALERIGNNCDAWQGEIARAALGQHGSSPGGLAGPAAPRVSPGRTEGAVAPDAGDEARATLRLIQQDLTNYGPLDEPAEPVPPTEGT